jgi:hypothetical protein
MQQEIPMSQIRPRPVYAPNTPLADLCTAELFVVASSRLWPLPFLDPARVHPDWRQGFACAGIGKDGVESFDALLHILATAAPQGLDVRCPRCAHLGEDEGRLLQLTSLFQQRRGDDATAILGDWLPPSAARIAVASAQRFATALTSSRLRIPHRHAEAATVHLLAPSAHASRGLALVQ